MNCKRRPATVKILTKWVNPITPKEEWLSLTALLRAPALKLREEVILYGKMKTTINPTQCLSSRKNRKSKRNIKSILITIIKLRSLTLLKKTPNDTTTITARATYLHVRCPKTCSIFRQRFLATQLFTRNWPRTSKMPSTSQKNQFFITTKKQRITITTNNQTVS